MTLYYDDLVPGTQADPALNKCQVTIGKANTSFLISKSKALRKCWDARLTGKHSGDCFSPSAGDGKYDAAVQKAADKRVASICKACGGADKLCNTPDDLTFAAIGFASECSLVTPPGEASCSQTISSLPGIESCTECVTGFKGDCVDRLAVPQFTPYPSECNVCTQPPATGPCPTTMSFTANGPAVDQDTGFTGLAHDATLPSDARITLAVSNCAGVSQPTCGQCDVDGPIPNAGGDAFDNHRCEHASWQQCSVDGDCAAVTVCSGGPSDGFPCSVPSECPGGSCNSAGPCVYFFGAPQPLRAGGVSFCILNTLASPIAGTLNLNDGSTLLGVSLTTKIHVEGGEFDPCPRCEGGTCSLGHGLRAGQSCTVNGTGQFGDVSLDCPPNPGSFAGAPTVDLNLATGVQTKTVEAANPTCRQTGYTGLKCLCDTCNNGQAETCSTDAECPPSGGGPGICGGRRCIGGTEDGQPCAFCIGGANHGATCQSPSACPGGTCSNPRICEGGSNDGALQQQLGLPRRPV